MNADERISEGGEPGDTPGHRDLNLTKITCPAPRGVMERARLFRRLDAGRRHPLVWVSGPAGSGKTTLVSSYLERRPLSTRWYQLDAGDADPATFFHYLGLAVDKAAPRRGAPLPHLTPEYLLGVPAFARGFFEVMCARLGAPSVIVLDNFQTLPAACALHAALLAGFSALPEGVSVIVLSRETLPPAFARLRANGGVAELGWETLRFTETESRRLWKLHGGKALSPEDSASLHARTAGWAAATVLLSRGAAASGEVAPQDDVEQVFDYFAGELFDAAPAGTRDFLLRTALLPSMTADMATALSDNDKASQMLQTLCRRHFFTERHRGAKVLYQYHPLFRAFLLARGEQVFDEAAMARLRMRAACVLMETQRFEEAAELLIAAGDWPALARLAVEQAPELGSQGRCGVLEGWFERLPGTLAEDMPWIHYWKGVCRLPLDPRNGGQCFARALNAFIAAGDAAGTFLSWAGVVDAILFGFEDFSQLDPWISRFDELLAELGPIPEGEVAARVAASMYAALVHRQPAHPDFGKWESRALAQSGTHAPARAQALLLHLCDRINAGNVAAIERASDAIRGVLHATGLPPLARLNAILFQVMYFSFMARPDACLASVHEGLALARDSGVHVMDFMLLGHGAMSALGNEDEKTADQLLGKMEALTVRARAWDLSFYAFLQGWRAFLKQDLAEARQHVDNALALTARVGAPFSIASVRLLDAHLCFACGQTEEAIVAVERLLDTARTGENSFWRFLGWLAQAEFLLPVNRDRSAACLENALAIGRREGYFHTFLFWRRRPMADLCVLALEEGIEVEYVRGLVRKRSLVPRCPPLHVETWPWPLKLYTLGRFCLLRDDAPLKFNGKGKHKPLEMLKLLVALGGREVREARVTDFLWPDADGDAAHSNFKTTLSRLRKWLGDDRMIRIDDGRMSLDTRRCWVDAWAFERAMAEAEAHAVGAENVSRVESALALYHGAFLDGEDSEWSLSARERLRRSYLQGLLELGLYREGEGQWEQAVECYRRGLRVEDLAEELYQRLMHCYAKLGLRAEALVTYQQCRTALNSAFGVEPSLRTRRLCQSIREND